MPEREPSAVGHQWRWGLNPPVRNQLYTYEPLLGIPRTTGKSEPRSVLIRNARLGEEFSLDRQGFQLVRQETAVHAFTIAQKWRWSTIRRSESCRRKPPVPRRLWSSTTRFATLNSRSMVEETLGSTSGHNDYTTKSGPRRVRDHLPAAEAEERLRHRLAKINA